MTELLADRGDTETINLTITKNASPVNLTDCKLWWAVASSTAIDAPKLIEKDSDPGNGITIVDALAGQVSIRIDNADTASWSTKDRLNRFLPWEIQIKDVTGAIQTIARGKIKFRSDIVVEVI